jgi:flagellar hook-length control protein FliK
VTVDNRDTLELLKSDARGLERALRDAGLKADSGNLSFSLRGHDTAARDEGGSAPRTSGAETGDLEDGSEPSASPDATYPQGGIMPDGRIDIRA